MNKDKQIEELQALVAQLENELFAATNSLPVEVDPTIAYIPNGNKLVRIKILNYSVTNDVSPIYSWGSNGPVEYVRGNLMIELTGRIC